MEAIHASAEGHLVNDRLTESQLLDQIVEVLVELHDNWHEYRDHPVPIKLGTLVWELRHPREPIGLPDSFRGFDKETADLIAKLRGIEGT